MRPQRNMYSTRAEMEPPRPGQMSRAATFDVNGNMSRMQAPPPRQNSWTDDPRQQIDQERPRYGTQRTASEPRGPPARQQMMDRSRSQRAPAPLFREQPRDRDRYDDPNDTVDDVYRMYSSPRRRPTQQRRQQEDIYLNEEDEYIDEDPESFSGEEMSGMGSGFEPVSRNPTSAARNSNGGRPSSKRGANAPEMRKIRVKVHYNEDTRYLMIGSTIDFGDLESKIREKFGIKNQLKIKMRDVDDGDMITMGDQDDLEMLISAVRGVARRERGDMGKMEVWVSSS
jgi:hypothetical protein